MSILGTGFSTQGISMQMPVLAAGRAVFKIKEIKQEPSQNNKPLLVVSVALAQPAAGLDGNMISPGFPVTRRYSLSPSEKSPEWDWRKPIVQLVAAAYGIKKDEDLPAQIEDSVIYGMVDKLVSFGIKNREYEGAMQHDIDNPRAVA